MIRKRLTAWVQASLEPESMAWFHGAGTLIALILTPPAVIFWKDSVPYLVMISQLAWVVGHWSGLQGALSEKRVKQQK